MTHEIDLYINKSETVMVSNPNTQLSRIHVETGEVEESGSGSLIIWDWDRDFYSSVQPTHYLFPNLH